MVSRANSSIWADVPVQSLDLHVHILAYFSTIFYWMPTCVIDTRWMHKAAAPSILLQHHSDQNILHLLIIALRFSYLLSYSKPQLRVSYLVYPQASLGQTLNLSSGSRRSVSVGGRFTFLLWAGQLPGKPDLLLL